MTHLSIHSVQQIPAHLVEHQLRGHAFPHDERTTLDFRKVVALKKNTHNTHLGTVTITWKCYLYGDNTYKTRVLHSLLHQAYLTLSPKANKIFWDLRDDVAVVVTEGAAADFWVCSKHLLTELLQLGMVTVKEQVPLQLFRTLHWAETALLP